MRALFLHLAALAACLHGTALAASIWVEGEAPAQSTAQKHNWYDAVKTDVLSGGAWLSHYGNKPGEAAYEIEVPAADNYTLWARLNPVGSEPRWRLDDAPWQAITTGTAQQQQNVAGDGKIDHRFIAWVKVGAVRRSRPAFTPTARKRCAARDSKG